MSTWEARSERVGKLFNATSITAVSGEAITAFAVVGFDHLSASSTRFDQAEIDVIPSLRGH
ncbi:reverse transcriptase-rnase h-integrase [Moniliophthora roreri]|nr:reverse transcriptase-rnase h-integrase [Moniliophthora roreri]